MGSGGDPRVGAEEAEKGGAMGSGEAAGGARCQEEEGPGEPETDLYPCPAVRQGVRIQGAISGRKKKRHVIMCVCVFLL